MTAETLSIFAGAVLSLLFSYVPGVNTWFAKQDTAFQRLYMLLALAVVALFVWGMACVGWGASWGITLTCDQAGAQSLLTAFVLALIANQGVYQITPQTAKVKAIRAAE